LLAGQLEHPRSCTSAQALQAQASEL
jgi:hypothetical protein